MRKLGETVFALGIFGVCLWGLFKFVEWIRPAPNEPPTYRRSDIDITHNPDEWRICGSLGVIGQAQTYSADGTKLLKKALFELFDEDRYMNSLRRIECRGDWQRIKDGDLTWYLHDDREFLCLQVTAVRRTNTYSAHPEDPNPRRNQQLAADSQRQEESARESAFSETIENWARFAKIQSHIPEGTESNIDCILQQIANNEPVDATCGERIGGQSRPVKDVNDRLGAMSISFYHGRNDSTSYRDASGMADVTVLSEWREGEDASVAPIVFEPQFDSGSGVSISGRLPGPSDVQSDIWTEWVYSITICVKTEIEADQSPASQP